MLQVQARRRPYQSPEVVFHPYGAGRWHLLDTHEPEALQPLHLAITARMSSTIIRALLQLEVFSGGTMFAIFSVTHEEAELFAAKSRE